MECESHQYLPVHREFALQARRTPRRIAIRYGDCEVSYEQLDARANAVAARLQELSVRAGDVVGLYMSRSPEIVIAKLAILKCGAAYLPLDKSNPVARNHYALAETGARVVISDDDPRAFHAIEGLQLLRCGADVAFGQAMQQAPDVAVSVHDRAYVMFTSGSTGRPKGVVVPHRAIHRLVKATDYISITEADAILQFSSLSFDAATFEIWGALLNGATLVLYPGTTFDPNLFAQELRRSGVSILFVTTALFHIIATRFVGSLAPLRILLTGGDVLYPDLINKVADAHPHLELRACYGPTENTSFTTTHLIAADNRPAQTVPIGLPIRGTAVHVLDEQLRPLPDGQTGELFVSGPGVALGYLNSPRSRNDFFEDPAIAAGLIYRTGDLVRRNRRGELEFVGRRDNQVKIRGFRASLEEIQNGILAVREVQDAVVLLRKFGSGDQQLVAFVRLTREAALSSAQLKQQLASQMPPYMVPDRLVLGAEFPLNSNGKICRDSLREMLDQPGMDL